MLVASHRTDKMLGPYPATISKSEAQAQGHKGRPISSVFPCKLHCQSSPTVWFGEDNTWTDTDGGKG